jgi:hypothetical protein
MTRGIFMTLVAFPFSLLLSIVTLAWSFFRSMAKGTATQPVQVALAWRIVQDDDTTTLFFLSHFKSQTVFSRPLMFQKFDLFLAVTAVMDIISIN